MGRSKLPSSGIYAPPPLSMNDDKMAVPVETKPSVQSQLLPPKGKSANVASVGAARFTPINASLTGGERGVRGRGSDRPFFSEPNKQVASSTLKKSNEPPAAKGVPGVTKPVALAMAESVLAELGALNLNDKQPGIPDPTSQTTPSKSTMGSGEVVSPSALHSSPPSTVAYQQPAGIPSYSSNGTVSMVAPIMQQPQQQPMYGGAYSSMYAGGNTYAHPTAATAYQMTAQPQPYYANVPSYQQPHDSMGYASLQQGAYGYPGYAQQLAPGYIAPQVGYQQQQLVYNPYQQMGGGSYAAPSPPGMISQGPGSQMAYGYGPYSTGGGGFQQQ